MADHPYGSPAWRAVRPVVLQRDGHRCQLQLPGCTGRATHVDHIIPWSEGGAWFDPTNLRAACEHCNTRRGAARIHSMAKLNRQAAQAPSREW